MSGQTLVTVGLMFDIIGVALLLAAPRVHPRGGIPLTLDRDASSQTRLRQTWSRMGRVGLSIVTAGFALQILGTWATELHGPWLVVLIVTVPTAVALVSFLVVRQLPSGD